MEELKSISELASEIKDERFLALFSAFVKVVETKAFLYDVEINTSKRTNWHM